MRLSRSRPNSIKRKPVSLPSSNPTSPTTHLELLKKVRSRPKLLGDNSPNPTSPKWPAGIGLSSKKNSPRPKETILRPSSKPGKTRDLATRGSATDRNNKLASFNSSASISRVLSPRLALREPELQFPIPGIQVLKTRLESGLTDFEKTEIVSVKEVYFLGNPVIRGRMGNAAFDDSKGDYRVIVGDHLIYRFEIIGVVGKGSFGHVCKCVDHKKQEIVAVKILRAKERLYAQGLVEVKALEMLRDGEAEGKKHILKIKSYFVFRRHLCIVTELLGPSIYDYMKASGFQQIEAPGLQKMAREILSALNFVHTHHIIHCDVKPENVLLRNSNSLSLRLIDFGSCCFEDAKIYSYIQSRFYRAPEIMLGLPYTSAIDIWSFGCVLAEMHTGRPLFPGEDEHQEILRILEVLGNPPPHLLDKGNRAYLFFTPLGLPKVGSTPRGDVKTPGSKSWRTALKSSDAVFIDLMQGCLNWDPVARLTAAKALQHPWFSST